VFESEVLRDRWRSYGAVSASLFVSSTAAHTDFMILVQDVFPIDTIIKHSGRRKARPARRRQNQVIDMESWPNRLSAQSRPPAPDRDHLGLVPAI
jgi:predicted acyl esterase